MESSSGWSVRLAFHGPITNDLMNALRRLMSRVLINRMEFAPGARDGDEPPTVTLELNALDEDEARILGQHLLSEAQRAAGAKELGSTVVWVAPVLGGGTESSHRFHGRAQDLLDDGDFDLAVVVAQIHLEVQVETLVSLALASETSAVVKALVAGGRGWPPHRQPVAAC